MQDADVENIKVGEHVTAAPLIPCHSCQDCKNGNYSLCSNYSFIGSRQQGAMADYLIVPVENIVKLDKNISFEQEAYKYQEDPNYVKTRKFYDWVKYL